MKTKILAGFQIYISVPLMIYKICGKSFFEIIPLPACYGMGISWNDFFDLSSEFLITWLFLFFFGSETDNSEFVFDNSLLFARTMVFCLKGWKFLRAQILFKWSLFFPWNFPHVLFSAMSKTNVKKIL